LTGQVQAVINSRNLFRGTEPSLKQIFSIKNEADELKEPEGIEKIDTFNKIIFSNVSFSYNGNKNVLEKINLSIPKHEISLSGKVVPTGKKVYRPKKSGKPRTKNIKTKTIEKEKKETVPKPSFTYSVSSNEKKYIRN